MYWHAKRLLARLRLTWRYFKTFGVPIIEPSHPLALERAKKQTEHYFLIKVIWNGDEQVWMAEMPEFPYAKTHHPDLPGAVFMAGDVLMTILEHDMTYNYWPKQQEK